ncbi:hypothetical protein Tco_1055861 [Tanacetum coccineum]|uniref:Uncharacterized protein n=1 Tax=Tanacetum coccineum TaxID=301880 RepID=A0ABQ5H136_9ASTR
MTYTSSRSSSSSNSNSKVHTYSTECLQSYETLQKQYDEHREILNKANIEIIAYQLGLESLESRIVVHQKNEAVYEESIEFLKYDVKLEKFETSSKNLTKLINSQVSANNKSGVGFDCQVNENELLVNKSEMVDNVFDNVFESAFDSSVNETEENDNQANNRYKTGVGYHAIPPPYTGNFMPPRPDLPFAGLDDSVFKPTMSETITSFPKSETSASKTSKNSVEQPITVRTSASLIKE